ncbi:MAG: hypothetical protein LBI03_03805 [Clostridiales bacterium]|nr:hypothetical protein [Clostridiales bacterium]
MKKANTKHDWQPTATQGYSMECSTCGEAISIYNSKTWYELIDQSCPKVLSKSRVY